MPGPRAAKRDTTSRPAGEEIHGPVSASVLLESFAKRPKTTSSSVSVVPAASTSVPAPPATLPALPVVEPAPIPTVTTPPAVQAAASVIATALSAGTVTAAATTFTTPVKRKPSQPHSATATPLPTQPPLLPQITDLKKTLHRRRSSYPPASLSAQGISNDAFVFGGTPTGRSVATLETFPGFGTEYTVKDGMAWTPGAGWEGLLDLGNSPATTTTTNAAAAALVSLGGVVSAGVAPALDPLGLGTSDPKGNPTTGLALAPPSITRLRSSGKEPAPPYAPVAQSPEVAPAGLLSANKIAQFGSDLVWRTILGSRVDVEEVGEVGVARVLQEVWRRGGGDAVTSQGLWSTILIALSFSTDGSSPSTRIPTPSSHAASALQSLYMLTLRHWEPAIFSGLLASFVQTAATPATEAPHGLLSSSHTHSLPALDLSHGAQALQQSMSIYGPATPKAELDLSQWMNVTPGADWSLLGGMTQPAGLPVASGSTPRLQATGGTNGFAGPGPSSLAFELTDSVDADRDRRSSTRAIDPEEQIRGIDELLAEIERNQEASERLRVEQEAPSVANLNGMPASAAAAASTSARPPRPRPYETAFQLPTPETDGSSDSPSAATTSKARRKSTLSNRTDSASQASSIIPSGQPTPPSSAGSPFAQTVASSSTAANGLPVGGGAKTAGPSARANAPTQLTMPTQQFVPPPPMCMFFSPAFHDLQKGKVGVWKGDLELRGRGGGKFAVLIVGEEKTGHYWQSQLWPESISYPAGEQANLSCTATMIPVAHLAREGFTPVAMGMVLCNDDNLSAFVTMVQGLHAEGVAFHLPGSTRLPIVFLPAKFDSKDPLQRLGVAFMSKPGIPLPPPPAIPAAVGVPGAAGAAGTEQTSPDDGPRRKRRRQSAPAKTHPPLPTGGAPGPVPSGTSTSSKGSSRSRRGTVRIEENVIVEEESDTGAIAAAA